MSPHDPWDHKNWFEIYVTCVTEEERKSRADKYFKKLIDKKNPEVVKNINTQLQETQKISCININLKI